MMTRFRGQDHYRKTLADIDSEMHDDDVKNLKFLSVPFIPKKFHTKFTSGLEIFEALEKCKKISEYDVTLLIEILDLIGRVDLSVMLKENAGMLGHSAVHGKYVDPFYILLFKLSEELTGGELQSLRYQYARVPKREQTVMGIDLFSFMMQQLDLSPTKLNILESLLGSIHRNDLVSEIRDYTNQHMKQGKSIWSLDSNINAQTKSTEALRPEEYIGDPTATYESSEDYDSLSLFESSPVMESSSSATTQETIPMEVSTGDDNQQGAVKRTTQPANSSPYEVLNFRETTVQWPEDVTHIYRSTAEPTGINVRVPTFDTQQRENVAQVYRLNAEPTEMNIETSTRQSLNYIVLEEPPEDVTQYYKMNSVPRGICLIIDNQIFNCSSDDVEATHLGSRIGSDKDCEALQETFSKLHFLIDLRRNLTDIEISRVIKDFSIKDHSRYDCFVCCILSHGGEGFVFGTNGRKYRIKELTNQFSAQSCPTLAGKPKLFFLQACRGKNHRPGFSPAMPAPNNNFETDAPSLEEDLVAPEADFVLGYATVSDSVSYRSKSTGTFYISELTRAINKFADKEDLLSILTRVNNEVSRLAYAPGNGAVYKQIPAPQFTLRKFLKFL